MWPTRTVIALCRPGGQRVHHDAQVVGPGTSRVSLHGHRRSHRARSFALTARAPCGVRVKLIASSRTLSVRVCCGSASPRQNPTILRGLARILERAWNGDPPEEFPAPPPSPSSGPRLLSRPCWDGDHSGSTRGLLSRPGQVAGWGAAAVALPRFTGRNPIHGATNGWKRCTAAAGRQGRESSNLHAEPGQSEGDQMGHGGEGASRWR